MPRRADPALLSPSGKAIWKFLGYWRNGFATAYVGGIRISGSRDGSIIRIRPSDTTALAVYDTEDDGWYTTNSLLLRRPTEILQMDEEDEDLGVAINGLYLIPERKRVAVYQVESPSR